MVERINPTYLNLMDVTGGKEVGHGGSLEIKDIYYKPFVFLFFFFF